MVLAAPTHPPLLHTPTHSVVFTPVQWKHITPRGPAWQGQRKWPGINGCFDYSLVTNVANMKDEKRRGGWLHPQWEAIWWHLRVSGPALMLPFGSHSNVGRYTYCTKCSGLDKSEVIFFFWRGLLLGMCLGCFLDCLTNNSTLHIGLCKSLDPAPK